MHGNLARRSAQCGERSEPLAEGEARDQVTSEAGGEAPREGGF
jgi:hypothetical protein